MSNENLSFETTASVGSVTELKRQFPHLPPRILVTLAVMTFLARTVTPFRLCQCGCGESVHGKARLASPACRQRVSREARAARATAPKQFNLVMQDGIPVPIPFSPAPSDHGSAKNPVTDPVEIYRTAAREEIGRPELAPINDFPNHQHFAALRRGDLTDDEIGAALVEITNDDGTRYVPNPYNNLRIACGRSYVYEFERWARLGIHPGALVEYAGKIYLLKRFEIESRPMAMLTNPEDTGGIKPIEPRYLSPATRASHTSQPHEPELFG